MTSVFISYSRKDRAAADHIAAELRNCGTEVFIDYQKLIAGEDFIGRLGKEIENREYFLLIVSPHSVASKWVKAEVSWALHNNKTIIPVLLEPANITDFFFLVSLEQVDFQRWNEDGDIKDSIAKLKKAIGIESSKNSVQLSKYYSTDEIKAEPHYSQENLNKLLQNAISLEKTDPEQALFLYKYILETNPDFAAQRGKNFIEQAERRMQPILLNRLKEKWKYLKANNEWDKAAQLAKDSISVGNTEIDISNMMISLAKGALGNKNLETARKCILFTLTSDSTNEKALDIIQTILEVSVKTGKWFLARELAIDLLKLKHDVEYALKIFHISNQYIESEVFYEQAVLAAKAENWKVVAKSLMIVRNRNPEHGDPLGILRNQPIQKDLLSLLYELKLFKNHNGTVYSLAFNPKNNLLASSSESLIIIWDIITGKVFEKLQGHTARVYSIAFSKDGKTLASASVDNSIILWDIAKNHNPIILSGHTPVAFSPDGTMLASGSKNNKINIYEITSKNQTRLVKTLAGHSQPVYSLFFSSNSSFLVSAASDDTIKHWRVSSGKELYTRPGRTKGAHSLAFSADENSLAYTANDKIVIYKHNKKEILTGHTGRVMSVAFSKDNNILVSTSQDQTLKFWDMHMLNELHTIRGAHTGTIMVASFSPDGKVLASGATDGTVKLWGFNPLQIQL